MEFLHLHVEELDDDCINLIFSAIKGVAFSVYLALSFLSAFGIILITASTCAGTIKLVVFDKLIAASGLRCDYFICERFAKGVTKGQLNYGGGDSTEFLFNVLTLFLMMTTTILLSCVYAIGCYFSELMSTDLMVGAHAEVGHFTVLLNFSCCAARETRGRTRTTCSGSRIR